MTAFCVAVIALASRVVAAQSTVVQASGSASVNVTDNARSTPDELVPGELPRQSDLFFVITPGLSITHVTPRLSLVANYDHPVALYVRDGSASNGSDIGMVSLSYAASAVDALTLLARASRSTTRQTTLGVPESSTVGTQPSGDNAQLLFSLSEALTHEFSQDWQGSQSLSATTVLPLDPSATSSGAMRARRWMAEATLGVSLRSGFDAWGLTASHGIAFTETLADQAPDNGNIIINSLRASWRRDLSPNWSAQLQAGGTSAYGLTAEHFYIGPSWGGSLEFNVNANALTLSYDRSIVPNVVVGPASLSDSLQLFGVMPLGETSNLALQGSAGGSYNQIFDAVGGPGNSAFAWAADVALGWAPPALPSFSLRYQHRRQFEPDEPISQVRGFHVNTAVFSMAYRFPVNRSQPLARQPSQRVDATDAPAAGDAPSPDAAPQ